MKKATRRLAHLLPRAARNWIKAPRATIHWLWDEVRHRAGQDRVEELCPGWRLRCHPGAYRLAYRAHLDDPEQARELATFVQSCQHGMILFDLGAHFGLFSLGAIHYGGPDARAIAIEPSAFACRILREEALMNGAGSQITVLEAAVADRSGHTEMIPVGVIAAGYYSPATETQGPAERLAVRAVTIDQVAREHGVWPTHLKIDVEGAEADALRGAGETLRRHPAPILFLELHHGLLRARGLDPGRTLDILDDAGYRISGLDGQTLSRTELLQRDLIRVVARREPSPLQRRPSR